ncbi:hypothetical protein PPERSA_07411 [Pseudocohnilembus persalinus]|uniref:EF-hand domain-containing protein n=1 Tax=Pseudocohnilembus persalinus TaxID=266149 RepID=A0A0V0QAF9_PSEPJ|nr:hypothetical protein PPERSA_07411 [Pseudocohnilembus persalinus]|eukprot:KRW99168.1 hypothetical protein PPERSA_07411 [Pseudocohnilembus persalinus]
MIDELKLRQVIADMFPELNQQNLDLIFDKLEHNTIPSKYMTQRKIYLPEFIGFMQSGIIFDPDFDEKSYKNFKNEKYNQQQQFVQKNENQKQIKDKLESQTNDQSDDDGESQQMQSSTTQNHRKQSSPTKNQNQQQQFIQQQNQKQNFLNNNYDFKRPDNKININNKNNQEKEKFVNPKQAGFVTKQPERAFTTINYNKNEIYSRFYQQIKDTLLPKKLLQYLTEKDLLQKSCLDLRKLFKKRDQGDGVLTLSDFREILEATFHKMNLNDINFLVSQALQKCAVGDIKDANQIAKDNLDYKFDKNMENQQGHIIKRVPENKNPRDPEISYSWFILNVQNELADILQITMNN